MSVVCAACKTENRDNAMFCHGCARKLPGFAATGPAALDIMKPLRPAQAPAADAGPEEAPAEDLLQLESRAFWIRLGLLALAITVGFVGWYAWVTRRAAPPATPVIAAPAAPAVATRPPQPPLSAAEALAPGETLAPPGAAAAPGPALADVFRSREGGVERRAPEPALRRRAPFDSPDSTRARTAGADPRPGCAHLNFVAAARCEAAQCARAEYHRHPHCDAVREQTRRDIARRDLTF